MQPVPTSISDYSEYIRSEARRLIRLGWLKDGRHIIPTGISAGVESFDVASRRPNEPAHRVERDPDGAVRCDEHCRGFQQHGRCTHGLLVRCFADNSAWVAVMFPDLPRDEVV